jgi:hypothetical protein
MTSEQKKDREQKNEIVKNPSREDVHEQRDPNQPREGVVRKPTQTQTDKDKDRADWEGMGQPQSRPGGGE